jgi:DNA invertase Pin-like site-specific DNA recombinase
LRNFGYARVSAADQNLQRQLQALTDYGLDPRDIVTDKMSGKDFNRPGYVALKNQMLREGDTLVIKELDRLGRSYEQMKTEWRELQELGVDIVVLDMPILNTKEKSNLEKALIANIVFELLSYTAEKERQKIKTRQAEGIAVAKKNGVHLGRPQITVPSTFDAECTKWRNGEQSAVETMNRLQMKRTTFYKLVQSA